MAEAVAVDPLEVEDIVAAVEDHLAVAVVAEEDNYFSVL
jgi:hypothetical protein